ncbi:DUF4148 domain-containing protein [Paraburkholderia sp. BCC1884]|uniref:DUF4148 domain-containing protein n=1 Tax=Paraburkholderia sp. BCC1884 TaxID=2562668 RepID=UPI0016431690|nr:DUF4148 domain-containing protein [Paraburkholderia sp. BCC1884]
MKPLRTTALLAVIMAFPPVTFAQNANGPLTREQVLQDLRDLEDVGYRPAQASSLRFPYDIEAAEQRVAAKKRSQLSPGEAEPGPRSASEPDNASISNPARQP